MMNPNISAETLENNYLNDTSFPIEKNNYVIISGISGEGKSTLLSELVSRGYSVVPNPGQQIVKEQTVIEGNGLPWTNLNKFLELSLSRYLMQYNTQEKSPNFIFFDSGIVETIQLDKPQPDYFKQAANKFRYNRLVFLVPQWEENLANDTERKPDFESAKKEFYELTIKYKNFGYETVVIPKGSDKESVDFVLSKLGVSNDKKVESNSFISKAKRLLEWNKEKLTSRSNLKIEDLKEVFAPEFVVVANGRKYEANYQTYYEFLNKFRSDIDTIDYQVQDYLNTKYTVVMPLKANVKRLDGKEDIFDAILIVTFNDAGKVVSWQEVYSIH